jgi:hypothetical protein
MAGERHGHGMLCVNPPLGATSAALIQWASLSADFRGCQHVKYHTMPPTDETG